MLYFKNFKKKNSTLKKKEEAILRAWTMDAVEVLLLASREKFLKDSIIDKDIKKGFNER